MEQWLACGKCYIKGSCDCVNWNSVAIARGTETMFFSECHLNIPFIH